MPAPIEAMKKIARTEAVARGHDMINYGKDHRGYVSYCRVCNASVRISQRHNVIYYGPAISRDCMIKRGKR